MSYTPTGLPATFASGGATGRDFNIHQQIGGAYTITGATSVTSNTTATFAYDSIIIPTETISSGYTFAPISIPATVGVYFDYSYADYILFNGTFYARAAAIQSSVFPSHLLNTN